MGARVFRRVHTCMVKCRYIPAYARVRFPMPGISVLGIRHPVDGYGAAGCRARPRRVAPRHAPRAGARARIRSARGHAPSIRCALRAALSNHRKGRAPLKSRDPPSLALTPCHARARDDGHKKGAARGESHRNKVPVRSP